jgi:choline dehydrogenase-like flavoprotein
LSSYIPAPLVLLTHRQGVVDASLLVHGTSNLRIIDASVIPFELSAHTQLTVYALADAVSKTFK